MKEGRNQRTVIEEEINSRSLRRSVLSPIETIQLDNKTKLS
jgi:hypothetical protein